MFKCTTIKISQRSEGLMKKQTNTKKRTPRDSNERLMRIHHRIKDELQYRKIVNSEN